MLENKMSFEELSERIAVAPFHKWLGIVLTDINPEGIELRVPWRPEFVVNVS